MNSMALTDNIIHNRMKVSQQYHLDSVQPGHHHLVLMRSSWRIIPIVSLEHIIMKVAVILWDYGKTA